MLRIVGFIQGNMQELDHIHNHTFPKKPMVNELLRPPNPDVIKLNFDASFDANESTSIAAVLARNHNGQIMGYCTYPFHGVSDAFVARARTCEIALLFATKMGFNRISWNEIL